MSRAWQALRALRLRLMGPAKELVGTDQFGNKYYRVPKHESRAGTHRGRAGGCEGSPALHPCVPLTRRRGGWTAADKTF